jgi:iron complex outermembrane receptor protein
VPRWFAEVGVEGAAAQERVGEFEEPTAAYLLLNAGAGVRWEAGGRLHSVTLQGDNLTDEVWRDHLSRIRELAPQPGINLRLLYRLDF